MKLFFLKDSYKKILYTKVIFVWLLACSTYVSYAQSDSAKSVRAKFYECDDLIKKGKYEKAIPCLQEMIIKNPTFIKPYIRLAEIYYSKKDNKNVLFYANKAIDINANEAYSPLTYLANKMMSNKDGETGQLILNRLSVSDLDTMKQTKAEKNRVQYNMKATADRTMIPGVHLLNMGDSINTKENEYLPSVSLDGNTLVYTRNVGGNEDFFIAKRDSAFKWHKAANMGYPPNTNLPDGAAKLSADGNYLFYTRCDMRSPDGIRGGGCDIVFSYRENDGWSAPQYFGYTINTTAYEGQPCLSSDNTTLYFVSNRDGGYGGMDIWMSKFENQLWTKPVNLGPTINTDKDETCPFIHPDNETLYFASNGHPGLGQTDLFVARKNKNGNWRTPLNLGAPINTEKFDGSIVVNAKGTVGYCTSDRQDTKGGLDIYSFDMYSAIQPIPTLCIKGFVKDKYYKNFLQRKNIEFTELHSQKSVGFEKSNEGDASYTKALQMGKNYMISCIEDDYRPYYKFVSLNDDNLPDIINLDIKLKQPGLIDTLYQCTLQFDTLHTKPDSLSRNHLDTVMKHWPEYIEDNSSVVIFLKGYYYAGDNNEDSTYRQNIETCFAQMQYISKYFERRKIECQYIIQDPVMLIWRDDELPFRTVEMKVVEYY